MSIEETKILVRRFYREIDAGNLDAMDELVAEDYVDHSPPPFPGFAPGREGLKQAFRMFWDATPGTHEIEDQIAEGDKGVTRLTCRGTHRGNLPGIPVTGHEMVMTATVIHLGPKHVLGCERSVRVGAYPRWVRVEFIGGCRWQRSGLGVGSPGRSGVGGGCSRVSSR
jgi:predicted ester cyclase